MKNWQTKIISICPASPEQRKTEKGTGNTLVLYNIYTRPDDSCSMAVTATFWHNSRDGSVCMLRKAYEALEAIRIDEINAWRRLCNSDKHNQVIYDHGLSAEKMKEEMFKLNGELNRVKEERKKKRQEKEHIDNMRLGINALGSRINDIQSDLDILKTTFYRNIL